MIKGKYIYLGCNLYKFVNPHKFDLSEAVSLINVMTGEFARHRDGIIIDSSYEADELFLYDSSFKFQVIDNSVTLFCTNPGMQMHYIADCNGVLRIVQGEQFSNYLSLFPILDKEATFVKDSLPIQNENERKVVAFGSSSTEIFDYICGDNENYLPFWASGWSARGLRKINEQMKPYFNTLIKIPKDSVILLHFGSVDTDFNLPYKMANSGFYDIPLFIKEMIDGILALKEYLNNLGFCHIYAVFTSPPPELPKSFWKDVFGLDQISELVRGKILFDFAVKLSALLPVINCLPDFVYSMDKLVCNKQFSRDEYDHHIDFISAQDIVYDKLKYIEGILPRRLEKHTSLYRHLGCDVSFIRKNNKPRLRTCR